jgi:aminoglycoside 2'-N-acetyltransferase I
MAHRVRRATTDELTRDEIDALQDLLVAAFGDDPEEAFGREDWEHALGGIHVIADEDGEAVGHAAVVERTIEIGGRPLATGYVEAVAIRADRQGRGIGSDVMTEIGAIIRDRYELGVLGTGRRSFYERLGWRTWRGPSGFHDPVTGAVRSTPQDDGYLMTLRTPRTPELDPDAPIVCPWRAGDVW